MLKTFAQAFDAYGYDYFNTNPEYVWPWVIISLIVIVVMLASLWKIFTKAKRPGWEAIIPIYNSIILFKIVGRPVWWIILLLAGVVPFIGAIVAIVVWIILMNDLAKSFGKGTGFTILLVMLPIVGYPMLAWGDATYKGPSVKPS